MSLEGAKALSGGDVPQAEGAVVGAGSEGCGLCTGSDGGGRIPESSLISGTYGASRNAQKRWMMSTREASHKKLDILETLWNS